MPHDDPRETETAVSGSGSLGATEDEVLRGEGVTTPDVTDMGLDERGRDQPDERDFGRGEMSGLPAVGDASSTGARSDVPGLRRSGLEGPGDAPHRDARDQERQGDGGGPRLTPSGTLASEEHTSTSADTGFGNRGDGGGGMLNTEVPEGMAGVGPLGGSPARGDTADAAAERRTHGIQAPSSAGSRGVHLGIGHNSPTGGSTPGTHPQPGSDAAPARDAGGAAEARTDVPADATATPFQSGTEERP